MRKETAPLVHRNPRRRLPKPNMDPTRAPRWWLTKPTEIRAYLESLPGVTIEEIGHSAGGRPLIAAAWGEREMLPGRTCDSLASAIAGGDPTAFYGRGERKRQVILFVGDAHGTEIEGTVAMLNFLNILVTGKDLRGRRQPQMAEEGRRHSWLIIPILNIDGRERAPNIVHHIGMNPEYQSMINQGLRKDGTIYKWPTSKLHHPMPLDELEILGTYFNDAGVNLVYDTVFGPDCQPETAALIRLCRREMPDLVILSHSDNGSLVQPPSSYIASHFKLRAAEMASVVGMACACKGYKKFAIPRSFATYAGDQFYQSDAIYHACGALPLVIEFPCGYQGVPGTHDELLDIGLTVLESISAFGNRYRFRPPDPKWK